MFDKWTKQLGHFWDSIKDHRRSSAHYSLSDILKRRFCNAVGRSRWKIENETFNTLKNQGYNLEHNYGHGKKYLATNFALLMLLAFLAGQIAQALDFAFQRAWQKSGSKKNLWQKVRQVFDLMPALSMNAIYKFIVRGPSLDFPLLE